MVPMTRGWLGLIFIFGACGGDDGGTVHHDAAVDTVHADAPIDSKVFMDAPAGTTPLTVKNVLSWCKVYVNGDTTGSTGSSIITNVTPGAITIAAMAAPDGNGGSLFKIDTNMWHHTDGDSGTGETGTVSGSGVTATSTVMATVVAGTPKCVWVCCPFTNGTGCNVPEQCP